MAKQIGTVAGVIDTRTCVLRREEAGIGNLVADISRASMHADISILNSGTIRSDTKYEPGPFTLKQLLRILPFPDLIYSIEVTGQQIWDALENGVCKYPATEGRFPQVSGLKFAFDPSNPPGSRIVKVTIGYNDQPIDLAKRYSLATKSYLAKGMDGYDSLKDHKVIVEQENGKMLPSLVRQYFQKLHVLNGFKRAENLALNVFSRKKHKQAVFSVILKLEGRITVIKEQSLEDMSKEQLIELVKVLKKENAELKAK